MNYEQAAAFNFSVASEAIKHFRRRGRAFRLSVHDPDDAILDWEEYEPAPGETPRCVEGDISFFFDDVTAPRLAGMHIFVMGTGTSIPVMRKNQRIHAHWTP